jgi:transcriptional regulator with XRE-family HTH domain
MTHIGSIIKQIRKEKALKTFDLAEFMHVDERTYRKYESGDIRLTTEQVAVIAEALKVEPIYIYERLYALPGTTNSVRTAKRDVIMYNHGQINGPVEKVHDLEQRYFH